LAASSAEKKQDNEGISSRKRLQVEWSMNVGEQILDLFVARYSRSLTATQIDIVALGERSLYCFKENGGLRFQKRLDFHPSCVTPYATEESKGKSGVLLEIHTNPLADDRMSPIEFRDRSPR
jgi:Bardet-Biedl syndrome 9 protein